MEVLDTVIGFASDAPFDAEIHLLSHAGKVEYLDISPNDVSRRRIRLSTDKGTDCAIALAREQRLADGAVLKLESDRAIVVRLSEQEWLAVSACDQAAALELGYFAGNLHWKVRFDGTILLIALEGPMQTYLDRLEVILAQGKVKVVGPND
ncbi:urease accessory protein UreE [Pontibaca salina]|uniref:Urease accessory protein UreE n=1 Tax=Pontibaca salina TaxID=2795731 RepID=A0A934M1T1_9RHOB|nr:urease accessory protein UreE [Pontibaca salina]MBI6629951.1 urease accessory protein UreE [Pontibaca salina]